MIYDIYDICIDDMVTSLVPTNETCCDVSGSPSGGGENSTKKDWKLNFLATGKGKDLTRNTEFLGFPYLIWWSRIGTSWCELMWVDAFMRICGNFDLLYFYFALEGDWFEEWKRVAPGCLGYTGDEILPSYVWGLFHEPWEGSLWNSQDFMDCVSRRLFFFGDSFPAWVKWPIFRGFW